MIFGEADERFKWRVGGQLWLQDRVFRCDLDRVLDQFNQLGIGLGAKLFDIELFLEVFVVVERKMTLMEGRTFCIVDIGLEGVN